MEVSVVIRLFLLSSLACFCVCEPLTPLVAWSNSAALSSVKGSKWSHVRELFKQTDIKETATAVVFKSTKLEFADLMKYGGAYGGENTAFENLQHVLNSAVSSVWGGVRGHPAAQLVQLLSSQLSVPPRYYIDEVPTSLSLESTKQLIVVELPTELKQQDAVIGKVIEGLRENSKSFVAFYTVGSDEGRISKRAADDDDGGGDDDRAGETWNLYRTDSCPFGGASLNDSTGLCMLICFTAPVKIYNGTAACELSLNKITAFDCSNISSVSFSTFKNCTDSVDSIKILFPTGAHDPQIPIGFYTITIEAEVTPPGEGPQSLVLSRAREDPFLYTNLTVPFGTSYACSSMTYYNYTSNGTRVASGNYTFQLTGLQVQPYNVTSNTFATSYNCQEYFSAPGWMGIFSIIILLIILYVSLVFMFSIKTIDRFDDPKGETISVENLH